MIIAYTSDSYFYVECVLTTGILYCLLSQNHQDMVQFLTLVEDSHEECHEEEMNRLFECLDGDLSSSSSSQSKAKKNKKDQKDKNQNQVHNVCDI